MQAWFDEACYEKNECNMKIYDEKLYEAKRQCSSLIRTGDQRKAIDQSKCATATASGPVDSGSGATDAPTGGLGPRMAYVVVLCSNQHISGSTAGNSTVHSPDHANEEGYTREQVAFLIVAMDAIIMAIFLIIIWLSEFLIQLEVNRHNNQLPECK